MKILIPLSLGLLSVLSNALPQADTQKGLPNCIREGKPLASFEDLGVQEATGPPSPPYKDLVEDGIAFKGFFADNQQRFPNQPTTGKDTVLSQIPPGSGVPAAQIVTSVVQNKRAKAFVLNSLDFKILEIPSRQFARGTLTVTCKTLAGKTVAKSFDWTDTRQNLKNVVLANANFRKDYNDNPSTEDFGVLTECTFKVESKDKPAKHVAFLMDNADWEVWYTPVGAKDCQIPK